jgi:hypothetical protein
LLRFNEQLANALGFHITEVVQPDGKRIVYQHDQEALEDSTYISYVPAPGTFAWTTTGWNNGSPVWEYGVTQDGNAVFRLLSTVGINANWITLGDKTLDDEIDDLHDQIENVELTPGPAGEDATTVFIESVNGNIFKNAGLATTLVVTVITGGQQIVSLAQLKARYGEEARLRWSEKKYGALDFTPLPDEDARLASDNFMLNISANDVDTKSTFRCDLLI